MMAGLRKQMTVAAVVVLVLLGVKYTIAQSELKYDIVISLLGIWIFYRFHDRLNQDLVSYGGFLGMIILHNLYLYPFSPLGINWDHYMHFFSGIALALIANRWFLPLKLPVLQRSWLIVLVVVGAGGIHEIVEWMGYGFLGEGDGFLFFGAGDEGEWRNAMIDMIFNLFGACAVLSGKAIGSMAKRWRIPDHKL